MQASTLAATTTPEQQRQWKVLEELAGYTRARGERSKRVLSAFGNQLVNSDMTLREVARAHVEQALFADAVFELLLQEIAILQWQHMVDKWEQQMSNGLRQIRSRVEFDGT